MYGCGLHNTLQEVNQVTCSLMCVCVCAKYKVCSVVFDGYQSPSMSTQKACADF